MRPPARGASCGTSRGWRASSATPCSAAREVHDYSFTDWIYGPTALVPEDEPELFHRVPLASADPALAG